MKVIILMVVGLLLFSTTALSELNEADLNKIRLIVKEEVEVSEKRMKEYVDNRETRMKDNVDNSETRMKDYITQEIKSEIRPVNNTIAEMDKRLNNIFIMVMTLGAFIAVAVGIPKIIVTMQGKDIKLQNSKLESQQKQIEDLLQEIESMKQQLQTEQQLQTVES